jgi:dihydrofolate reductase
MPVVAERMNNLPKIVFSRTMEKASWSNTRLIKGDLVAETRKLKSEPGQDMVIMGSGSIVAQLTAAGLIDEFDLALVPIMLGSGRTLFEGVTTRPALRRTQSRSFENGAVFLRYETLR